MGSAWKFCGWRQEKPSWEEQVYTAIDVRELRSSPLWLTSTEGACAWRRNSSGYVLATVLFTFPVVTTDLPDTLEGLILTPSSRLQSIMTGTSQKAAGHVTLTVKEQRVRKASVHTHFPHLFCPGSHPGWCRRPHQLIYSASSLIGMTRS